MKILNFGSLNIDSVYQVDHLVLPGETISSLDLQKHSGGKGLNQSIALARSGGAVYHAGAIGAEDGAILKEVLLESGANIDYLAERKGIPSGHAIIQVDKNGQNCIILYGGSNQTITAQQVEETLANFDKGDFLVLQNEINYLGEIMEEGHRKGMRIVLNPSPMDEKVLKLPLEYVEYFNINEVEAEQILGGKSNNYLDEISAKYPNAKILLTLGKDGVAYLDEKQRLTHGIYDVPVVDTTAAGDTFTGFFFGSLSQGCDEAEALRRASVASSIAVSRSGAVSSIPTLKEVLESNINLL